MAIGGDVKKTSALSSGVLSLVVGLTLAACGRSDISGRALEGSETWRPALVGAGAPLGTIPPDAALADTAWQLELLRGQPPVAGSQATLMFTDLQISGRACNYLMGTYALDEGGLIRLGSTGRTLMGCAREILDQEETYLHVLREAERYRREGDRLAILTAAGEEQAVFRRVEPSEPNRAQPQPQTPEQQLAASTWIQNEAGTNPLPGGAALRFNGGQLELQVGCLRLTGPYETSGWRIRLLHQYNAEQLCAPGPDEPAQIRAFLERLGRARFFWPSQGSLRLETADGKALPFLALREGLPAAAPLVPGRTLIDPTPGPVPPPPTPYLPTSTPPEPSATPTPAATATPRSG